MKTLYITDLDGTLLNSEGKLSLFTEENLNKLIRDGVLFTVATARTSATVLNLFRNVNMNIPFVLMNGVLVYDPVTKKNISAHKISSNTANKIIEVYKRYNNSPMLYFLREDCIEIVYNRIHNKHQESYISARDELQNIVFRKVEGDLKVYEDDNLIYMVSLDKPELLSPIYKEITESDDIYCAFYSDNYTDCHFMESMNRLASKGSAALRIKDLFSIDRIVAFGDNLNDIPLFSVADECYAVGNACDELKQIATGIIDTNDNDGVVKFILDKFYSNKEVNL